MAMRILLPATTLWWRELVRFLRQGSRVMAALGTPLLFWFFLGSGIGASFHPASAPADMNYLKYFYPGTLILIILFTSVFSAISLIEDRKEGFLLSVLVAPVSRWGPVLGKILGGATLALLQGLVLLALAPFIGISLGIGKVVELAAILFVNAFALTSLGFALAWQMDSTQGFHGVMNLILFPMWLLSGALFPPSGASGWMRWMMLANPLTYGFSALHHVLYGDRGAAQAGLPSFITSVAVIVVFALVLFFLAAMMARRRTVRGLG
ncbi:MAG: ABC transporter permease [Acidobacteriota bacterium]